MRFGETPLLFLPNGQTNHEYKRAMSAKDVSAQLEAAPRFHGEIRQILVRVSPDHDLVLYHRPTHEENELLRLPMSERQHAVRDSNGNLIGLKRWTFIAQAHERGFKYFTPLPVYCENPDGTFRNPTIDDLGRILTAPVFRNVKEAVAHGQEVFAKLDKIRERSRDQMVEHFVDELIELNGRVTVDGKL